MALPRPQLAEYKHPHALSQPGQFRLMRLKQQVNKAVPDEILTVSFQHASLEDNAIEYVALSYAWGTAKPTARIQVRMGRRMFYKDITPTLDAALRRLQLGNKSRLVWADALCINQDKHSMEKNLQVMQMDRIYHNARKVSVWLGDSKDQSDVAMGFISRLGGQLPWELGPFVKNVSYAPAWEAVRALIGRPWFSRRWILQEIVLARHANVLCGNEEVPWSCLEQTVNILIGNISEIKNILRRKMESNFLPPEQRNLDIPWNAYVQAQLEVVIRQLLEPFEGIPESTVGRLVRWREQLIRHDKNGTIEKRATLEYLVSTLAGFQVSEPRDTLYALCALASDGSGSPNHPIVVNYNKSVLEICVDFVDYCIATSRSLDIILRPWAPTLEGQTSPLPSWVRSVSHSEFAQDDQGQLRRLQGSPFVKIPKIYSASKTTEPHASIAIKRTESGSMNAELTVTGIIVDTVKKVGEVSADGTVPPDWRNLVGWQGDKLEDAPTDFLMALVAGREPDHYTLPRLTLLAYSSRIWKDGDSRKPDLSKISELTADGATGRVHAVARGRRIFISKLQELIGLGPSRVREDDLVCIFHGCSVPVVLRPIVNGIENLFELIGEAYIHSIMNGEALQDSSLTMTFILQ